jgi:hypothetical protein
MGAWGSDQQRMNVATLQWTKGFMPPFAGTPTELESLVQYIQWETAKRPVAWPESRDERVIAQIKVWLDEAGTGPATQGRPPAPAASAGSTTAAPGTPR